MAESNFFDDAFSQHSASSKQKKENKKESKQKEEEIQDKKKLKVLKEALITERKAKEDVAQQFEALQKRNRELEKECQETSNKYLRLYDENERLQECIKTSHSGIKESEGTLVASLMGENQNEITEMLNEKELQHEAELTVLQEALRKAGQEASYQELEANHLKTLCKELAEKLDKAEKKIGEQTNEREGFEKQTKKMQNKVIEHEVRIGQLNLEKANLREERQDADRRISEILLQLLQKDQWVKELQADIKKLNQDIADKEQVIKDLSATIVKKGKENGHLSQIVSSFKSSLIIDQIFQTTFAVLQVSQMKTFEYGLRFVRDKSDLGEFYLELIYQNTKKRILVLDIEEIQPLQGTQFELRYYTCQSYFSQVKSIKVEVFESKFIADIIEAFEQVCQIIDEAEAKLEKFKQGILSSEVQEEIK